MSDSYYDAAQRTAQRRSRRLLLLIVLVCLLPVIIAILLFYTKPAWLPVGATNRGELVQPLRRLPPLDLTDAQGKPVPLDAFRGHWTLIYIGGPDCNEVCARQVLKLRNIRPLLQEQQTRLRVVYLAPDAAALERAAPILRADASVPQLMSDGGAPGRRAHEFFARPSGSVVMIDPLTNWVLAYPPGYVTKDVYLDLKHLLRYSQIG